MKIEQVNSSSVLAPQLREFTQKYELTFNSQAWLQNYPPENICQCAILNNNNDVIGTFIYYRFRKAFFDLVITAPFAPNIDLFYINPSESVVGKNSFNKELMENLASYFNSLGVNYINVNLPFHTIDTQPFTWKGFTAKTRYSYLISLSHTEETLWNNLSSEKRKSVNKAVKDGLEIKPAEDFGLVYELIIKSLERNFLAKNKEVIKSILFSYAKPSNSFSFIAYKNAEPAGATFCVIDRKKAVYLFGGFDTENKHHGAGVSCMWQSILKAKSLGLEYFDFEGSMNINIERYFREFGGELSPYFCVEKSNLFLKYLMNLKGHKY